jgi:hypothetical protein
VTAEAAVEAVAVGAAADAAAAAEVADASVFTRSEPSRDVAVMGPQQR